MPAKNPSAPDKALEKARKRIREAEAKLKPIGREWVAYDQASLDNIVVLIERGVGKKPEVLRAALATGLRVLVSGTDNSGGIGETVGDSAFIGNGRATGGGFELDEQDDGGGQQAGVDVARALGLTAPITKPLSERRKAGETIEEEQPTGEQQPGNDE